MNIIVETYTLNVSDKELYILAFAILDKLQASVDHCARHDGMRTFWFNYTDEAKMLESMCTRLDRPDIYTDLIQSLEKKLEKVAD